MGKRERKSFTLNPEFCLFDLGYEKPKSSCVFDFWSIHHFYWQGFVYIIIHHLFKINKIELAIKLTLFLSCMHILEEYIGNKGSLSLEGIVIDNIGPLVDPKINPKLRGYDNDYLDNSIGDVLSGLLCNILIVLYWYFFNRLPYFFLFGSIIIVVLLLKKARNIYYKK